jgi:dTDP-4-amino-4,6-dideoxygalactose transaminase
MTDPSLLPIRIPSFRPCLGQEESEAIREVIEGRWLGIGKVTERFEQALREHVGAPFVIATTSGTAALHLALTELGLTPGDEVIVPSMTFVATIQMIQAAGATPVFCEVEPETLNMDPDHAAELVGPRTRALLPVHYGGEVCDMQRLAELANRHGLRMVDDAAHAFGSHQRGRPVGTLADLTCFSFDPIKNITCGEGGAVATSDPEYARRIILRRNLGIQSESWNQLEWARSWNYTIVSDGYRYAMPNLNAAIGLRQLERVVTIRDRKRQVVRCYDDAFRRIESIRLLTHTLDESFPFSYVIRVVDGRRDQLLQHLRQRGIGATVQFTPNHLQPHFSHLGRPLPTTELLYGQIITLPLYAEITDQQVAEVIETVTEFMQNHLT